MSENSKADSPGRVTWDLFPLQSRRKGDISVGDAGAFGKIVPSLEDPGTAYRFPCYRLSDDELRSFRESFPNHDPTDPPWHLIEQRLRCVTFGQLDSIGVPEILDHLRGWSPSMRANSRWGVVAMPETPCGQFAEFVLELFDAAWNAHELDQLGPKIESHVERILNAWPTKESTLGLFRNAVSEVSGHAREEKIVDLLSQFRGEIDRLEESAREYSRWHKGEFGQCSIASPDTAMFARFAELIPWSTPKYTQNEPSDHLMSKAREIFRGSPNIKTTEFRRKLGCRKDVACRILRELKGQSAD